MSLHAVEKLMYEICNSGVRAEEYRRNCEALLDGYALTDLERQLVRELDVRGLTDHRVNPMLIMTTWNTLVGPDHIGEYLKKLNSRHDASTSGVNHG